MTTSKKYIAFLFICAFVFSGSRAFAALTPLLSLSSAGGGLVQVNVNGADPGATVMLNYSSPSSSGYTAIGIGSTNSSGSISTTINPQTYNISTNSTVYVVVDGVQSAGTYWPSTSGSGSSGSLSLSQTVLNLGAGQSGTVTVNNAVGAITVTSNTNSGTAISTVSGNSVVITAYNNPGTTVLTICDSTNDCGTLTVSVLPSSVSTFSLSSSVANVVAGESQTITMTGVGPFSVASNSNPSILSASINGNNLVLNGISLGTATLSVCESNNQCSNVSVSVNGLNSVASASTNTTVSFSPSTANLALGQSQTILMSGNSGSGQYYISGNSNSNIASAVVSGSNLNVTGVTSGSDTITVCATGVSCGNLYVTVSNSTVVSNTTTTTSNQPPVLSSVTMSSNGANNSFLGAGSVVTLTFNVNQSVTNPMVRINNVQTPVIGTGSGPYTASYTVTSSESQPIPVSIYFTNSAGIVGQGYLWIGNSSSNGPSTTVTTQTTTSSGNYSFDTYLYMGMTARGVSNPDVVALQKRLTADSDYSGPITGYFGPLTQAGVEAYQTQNGLNAIGVVGPSTRNLLNKGI